MLCVRVQASYPSTILPGPGTIRHHIFLNLKSYLQRTQFNYRTEISHAIQKYNRPLKSAWFMHVYIELGETISVLHIQVSTLRRRSMGPSVS